MDDDGTPAKGRRRRLDTEELLRELTEVLHAEESARKGGAGGAPRHGDAAIRDILETVLGFDSDGAHPEDIKMVLHALREMRRAFHVFAPYRFHRKVSVFGSARTRPDQQAYQMAMDFANRITRLGYMVITGAGPGIMEAAQGGAGRARSFGVNIRLPFEQGANEFIHGDSKLVHFKYFFTRKVMFVKEADAIVLFPGGFGTHDEGFESLTLVQTGKSHLVPLVFIEPPGGSYWREWFEYIEKHLKIGGYISPEDLSLFHLTDNVEDALDRVTRFYANFHSTILVGDRFVIRHREPLSDEQLDHFNAEYSDMLHGGRIERVDQPFPVEEPQQVDQGLHRFEFRFDRKSFGRLRQLVDELNAGVESTGYPRR